MKSLWIDIETYSSVDLPKYGVYRYAESPDFLILMASWSTDGENVQVAIGEEEINEIPGLHDPRTKIRKVAHNASFERICFSAMMGLDGYLPPEDWHDTQAVAAQLGYPKKLEKLATILGGEQKDTAGTRLINIFCKPNRQGRRTLPEERPEDWAAFVEYARQDTVTLIDVDRKLGDFPTEHERQVFFVDQKINDRGIRIDRKMAELAMAASVENQIAGTDKIVRLTAASESPVANPNSIPQMTKWMRAEEIPLPNLRSETVGEWLQANPDHPHREVLRTRLEVALAASKKFSSALGAVCEDDRLHGTLAYFGAHTGRWAGRGTQIQNLPRASFETEEETEAAILDLMLGLGGSPLTLKKLVRPLFIGPFTVVDYSAIEAIVLAWLAGEEWVMEAFRAHRDIYVETAERMGGLTRPQGKIAVLALGYNGGSNSLRNMAGDKDFLPNSNELIRDAPDDVLYERFVYPWRDANANTVKLWKILDRKFRSGGKVGEHLSIEKDGSDRFLRLPSGRAICYRKCKVVRDREGRERITFLSSTGQRTDTYGGRLAENATQAVARDLLAAAIVRLEERGYPVVGHVHDEALVEGEYPVDEVAAVMNELPSWAEGLPVRGEGFTTHRYRKG